MTSTPVRPMVALIAIVLLLAIVLSACAAPAPTPVPPTVAATKAPASSSAASSAPSSAVSSSAASSSAPSSSAASSKASSSAASSAVSPTTAPTQPPAASSPVVGGTLTYAQSGDAVSLYPHRITELISGEVTLQMEETLVRLNAQGETIPHLAKSWKVSDDGKTWTFTLVSGVKFHDGTPFNAEAVKFNLDYILDTKNALPSRSVIDTIDKVEAKDATTVVITTKTPYVPMLYHLSHYSIGMVSPAAIQKYGKEIDQNPVGTGPYKFVKWVPKESIELVRNEDYWGAKPFADKIIFRSMPEGASRVAALEKGEVDVITNVPPQDVDRLKTVKGVNIQAVPFNRVIFIHLNNAKKPFDNVNVRRAVNMAVNRQSIVTNILKGLGSVADGPVASNVYGFSKQGLLTYDVNKAKALLAEAGYPNGFETTIYTPNGRYLADRETAEAVAGQLAAIGIKAKVQVMEWSAYLAYLKKPAAESEYQMALLGLGPSTNEADWVLYGMYHSDSRAPVSNNRSYYSNAQADDLIMKARAEVDQKKQLDLYSQALKLIENDAPDLWLHELKQVYGLRDNVNGFETLPIEQVHLEKVWKSK